MPALCETCHATPLDDAGHCVTCDAKAEGLETLTRSGYAEVREMMQLLEDGGLAPEMEKVPEGRPEEKVRPLWNLYVPAEERPKAVALLQKDWAELLQDSEAAAAAARGQAGIDLDAGGEVACPACGHRFVLQGALSECPECGLGLGVAANAAPDEQSQSS
jgi:hypothetical protein